MFKNRKTDKIDVELVLDGLREAEIECNEKIDENKSY